MTCIRTTLKHRAIVPLTALAVVLLFALGCRKLSEFYEHFIYGFETKNYKLEIRRHSSSQNSGYNGLVIAEAHVLEGRHVVYAHSKGADRALYKKLCSEVGDVAYNRKERLSPPGVPDNLIFNTYFAAQVKEITLSSNVDWDSSHPAGSSLDDLFVFLSYTPDKYTKQGYANIDEEVLKEYDKVVARFGDILTSLWRIRAGNQHFPIAGLLSEIDFSAYRFIGRSMMIGELYPLVTPPAGAKVIVKVTFEGVGVRTAEYTYP